MAQDTSPRDPDKVRHDEDEIPENRTVVQTPVEMESAMDTDSDEADMSIEDRFSGEMTAQRARELLREAEPEGSEETEEGE